MEFLLPPGLERAMRAPQEQREQPALSLEQATADDTLPEEDALAKEVPPLPSRETFIHTLQEPLLPDHPPTKIITESEPEAELLLPPTTKESTPSPSSWRDVASSLLDSVQSSRFAKPLFMLGAFIGIPLATSHGIEQHSKQGEQTAEIIHEVSKLSPLEAGGEQTNFTFELPAENDILTFADGHQETRGDVLLEIDRAFTKELTEKGGPLQSMMEDCGKTIENEKGVQETIIDVFRCQALYGNQYGLHREGGGILAAASGYSEEELKLYGKAMRGGVLLQPILSTPDGLAQLIHHDFATLPDTYHTEREAIYDGYLDDASEVTLGVIKTLNLADASQAKQKTAIEALRTFAQAYVEFGNQSLVVGSSMENLNNAYVALALTDGLRDPDTGMQSPSEIQLLWKKSYNLDLAAKAIVTMEKDANGPLHAWANSLERGVAYKMDAMFDAGMQTGKENAFFAQQQERLQ